MATLKSVEANRLNNIEPHYRSSCENCKFRTLAKHPRTIEDFCRLWYRDEVNDMTRHYNPIADRDKTICALHRMN